MVAELPVLGPAVPFDIVNSFTISHRYICDIVDCSSLTLLEFEEIEELSGFTFHTDSSTDKQHREGFEQLARTIDIFGGIYHY